MSQSQLLLEIRVLPVDQRLDLVEQIWDSICEDQSQFELTDAQKADLDRRLASHAESAGSGSFVARSQGQAVGGVMAFPLKIEPEAELDLIRAYRSYEDARTGLGRRFVARLDDTLDRIAENPEIHALTYRNVRQTLVRKFPWVVCYTFEDGKVSVVAIYHGHRNPDDWKSRLE